MKETLEKAAQRFYPMSKGGSMWMPSADDCNKANKQEAFIAGAKWQEQRMYSEKDMRGMYDKSCGLIGLELLDDQTENDNRFKEIFEKFKKK